MKRNLVIKIIINVLLVIIFSFLFYVNTNDDDKIPETINIIRNGKFVEETRENIPSITDLIDEVWYFIFYLILIFIINVFTNSYFNEGKILIKSIKWKIIKWLIILFIAYIIYGAFNWVFTSCLC